MTPSTGDSGGNAFAYRLSINYESDYGNHSDNLCVQENNLAAVIETLPAAICNDLKTFADETSEASDGVYARTYARTYDYIKGKLFNNDNQVQTVSVALDDFIRHPGHNIDIEPRLGRFYPATLFNSDRLKTNKLMVPLRLVELMYKELLVNTSHALCNYNTSVTLERYESDHEAQTLLSKHLPVFLTGPGMQLRYNDRVTDFFSDDPYRRSDDTIDSEFYSQPRHINHLDKTAQAQLKSVYNDLIPAAGEILDLMSSINLFK